MAVMALFFSREEPQTKHHLSHVLVIKSAWGGGGTDQKEGEGGEAVMLPLYPHLGE